MKKSFVILLVILIAILTAAGCSDNDDGVITQKNDNANVLAPIVVGSLTDAPLARKAGLTLRAALNQAVSGQPIVFDPSLDGGVIQLTIVGEEHTILKGEVMTMVEEDSGPVSHLVGYFNRDYGRSALYAQKNVVLDASTLPNGITLEWAGVEDARVLAVYGQLTMKNVTITGGRSVAVDISEGDEDAEQPYSLARGGAVAVWGTATLEKCTIYGNYCQGDFKESRDRGAFGGGIYADIVRLTDCIISGNSIFGAGAAGGGVYSITGAGSRSDTSTINRCSITGNHITAIFTYGGGVYSDGGSIGNSKTMEITNSTVAQNLVDAPAGMPAFLLAMGYWRGAGFMSPTEALL